MREQLAGHAAPLHPFCEMSLIWYTHQQASASGKSCFPHATLHAMLSNMAATGHKWLLRTLSVIDATC